MYMFINRLCTGSASHKNREFLARKTIYHKNIYKNIIQ